MSQIASLRLEGAQAAVAAAPNRGRDTQWRQGHTGRAALSGLTVARRRRPMPGPRSRDSDPGPPWR